MFSKIKTLIIEEDSFACDFSALLLARDWRTQVIGQLSDKRELNHYLGQTAIDVLIWGVGNDDLSERNHLQLLYKTMNATYPQPLILYTFTIPQQLTLNRLLPTPQCRGYFWRKEVGYCLAKVISLVKQENSWVISPAMAQFNFPTLQSGPPTILTDKYQQLMGLCPLREQQVLRFSVLFDMSHRDIGEELGISETESRKALSRAYKRLEEHGVFEEIDQTPFTAGYQKPSKSNLAFYSLTDAEVIPTKRR